MNKIEYFDTSINQKIGKRVGHNTTIPLDDLVAFGKAVDPHVFRSENFIDSFSDLGIDLYGQKKSQKWEMALGTMMYLVSGQVPSREDIKRGRQIIERLPKNFKSKLGLDFLLTFLPYVLVGFNINLENRHVNESNKIDNIVQFILETYDAEVVLSWSFLCAHRDASNGGPKRLVDKVVEEKILRTISLQKGLFANTRNGIADIVWWQQQPTERSSSNMFPDLFLRYLQEGTVADMLLILDGHFTDMAQILLRESDSRIKLSLGNQDEFTQTVENKIEEHYGPQWRDLQNKTQTQDAFPTLVQISVKQTMEDISRISKFYNGSISSLSENRDQIVSSNLQQARKLALAGYQLSTGQPLAETTERTIDWFLKNHDKTFFAKSLYESFFYFYWGAISSAQGRVAVGIDRDYARFQVDSWSEGYKQSSGQSQVSGVPIGYTRRTEKETAGRTLKDISYRQFWRRDE